MQVVLGRLRLDMRRFVREVAAGGMDALALRLQDARDRVLSEPVHLKVGHELAQLAGDRHVAPRVAEPDRRADVERAWASVGAVHRRVAAKAGIDELADREVDLDGAPSLGQVVAALNRHEPAAGRLRQRPGVPSWVTRSLCPP